jgi:CRISPR/Cas system-associated exonuclease Cas4 (RecB family)
MYKFSPTGLALFNNCPRCFWLNWHGIKMPRGIFPSLPRGMDLVIKKYFDTYREQDKLPPEIEGQLEGKLFKETKLLESWRSWKHTNLIYFDKENQVQISGALDDCIQDGEFLIPLDYKTRGSALKSDNVSYYTFQLSTYELLLSSANYPTTNYGYLLFFWPKKVEPNCIVTFETRLLTIPTKMQVVKDTIVHAKECVEGDIPDSSPECEMCKYIQDASTEIRRIDRIKRNDMFKNSVTEEADNF